MIMSILQESCMTISVTLSILTTKWLLKACSNVKITQKHQSPKDCAAKSAFIIQHLQFCDLNISSHLNKLTPLYSPLSSKKELKNIQFSFFYQFMWPNVFHCVQHYIVIILFTDYTYTVILEMSKV